MDIKTCMNGECCSPNCFFNDAFDTHFTWWCTKFDKQLFREDYWVKTYEDGTGDSAELTTRCIECMRQYGGLPKDSKSMRYLCNNHKGPAGEAWEYDEFYGGTYEMHAINYEYDSDDWEVIPDGDFNGPNE